MSRLIPIPEIKKLEDLVDELKSHIHELQYQQERIDNICSKLYDNDLEGSGEETDQIEALNQFFQIKTGQRKQKLYDFKDRIDKIIDVVS